VAGTRREARGTPQLLILDSGAVIALARRDTKALAFLARAIELRIPVEVPVVVVAETVRGGPRDAPINWLLKAIGSVAETRERHGRTAGRLLGLARSASTVDALVVAQAVEAGGAHILTGDPDDLKRLAAPHPEVWIEPL
jgi:predicted nucleic acid-binding protein